MTIMNNNTKVCLTTFIYGIQYQNYIPFLLYSCYKAYPEYDVVLFLYDKLDEKIKVQIDSLELKNKVVIHENHFYDCPNMNPRKSQALRWVVWDNIFNNYDFLYTVDIDMLYIREPIPLHIQHIQHMDYIGLPISNLRREFSYNPFNIKTLAYRILHARVKSIFQFFLNDKKITRLTGLHFVDIKKYYSIFTQELRDKFKEDIYTDNYLKYVMYPNDEALLACIVESLDIDISKLGLQKNSTNMLDFNHTQRLEFRPHHGIHMGIFRGGQSITSPHPILESNAYTYYLVKFKKEVLNDSKFYQILEDAPDNIKIAFKCLFQYYGINN
jgi:hypothetical protein